jgi:hypothetical protein
LDAAIRMEKAVKIGQNTQRRIDAVKDEALEVKRQLETLHARLTEHPGTKRIAYKLERVIDKLEDWRRVA